MGLLALTYATGRAHAAFLSAKNGMPAEHQGVKLFRRIASKQRGRPERGTHIHQANDERYGSVYEREGKARRARLRMDGGVFAAEQDWGQEQLVGRGMVFAPVVTTVGGEAAVRAGQNPEQEVGCGEHVEQFEGA